MENHNAVRIPRIGEVYLMEFRGRNSEQSGVRPGVVFQNNVGNSRSANIIALPLSSSIKKMGQPTHVFLDSNSTGLRLDSIVICENPEAMSKEKIGKFLTLLSDEQMKKITEANLLATSAISFLDIETLLRVWKAALALNAIKA